MSQPNQEKNYSVFVLFASIAAVSTAAPLAKMSLAEPIAIGFWRTLVVGVLLLFTVRPQHFKLPVRLWMFAVLAGALLAGHFWAWFSSLHYTSTLRSTVLVCLNPIWVALFEWLFLRHKPTFRFWVGVVIGLCGIALMSHNSTGNSSLIGDLLAVLGGVLGAIYLLVGRLVRQHMDIGPYGSLLCLSCAIWLLFASQLYGQPLTGYANQTWIVLLLMALGPQLIGHIGLNYAVRYVAATMVAMLLLLEPVGAALLAAVFLQELPTIMEVVGSLVILCGVGIGISQGASKEQTDA